MSLCLAQNAAASAASSLFADIWKAPVVQRLVRRVEAARYRVGAVNQAWLF